jgi:hypothetical protein
MLRPWTAVALFALGAAQGAAQTNRALWDFETPDQADWHFVIEGGKGELTWRLAGPEAEPYGGHGCLAVDFRFGGDPENHLKLEWYRRSGAWDLRDYVGLEAWVKPVGGAGRALALSHWFNDGTHWWHYRTQGWDDLQDDRWNRVTIAFEDGVEYYGPDAGYDPAKASQLIFVVMNRRGLSDATGTVYLDDIRLIERPGLKPPYRPQVGVWFAAAFKPDGTPNPVLNWRLPRAFGIRPAIGYYDSADPQTIAWQFEEILQTGIDFLIIDVPPLDPMAGATQAVLRQLRAQPEGVRRLQYCFQLESYGATPSPEVLRPAAEAIWEACASDPLHFRYQGKPLLIVFSPIPAPADRWQDERFTVRWVTPEPGAWNYCDAYPQTVNRECMCVSPGACNLLEYLAAPQVVESIFRTEAQGGAYLAKQMKWALDNQPDLIYLASWNDWAFGNMLEPSDEYGERYVNLLAEMLDIYAGVRRRE